MSHDARIISPSRLQWGILSPCSDMSIVDVRGGVAKPGGRVSSGMQRVEYVSDAEAYLAGHIPGAVFLDWREVDMRREAVLCKMFAERGVERGKMVWIYDWGDMLFATRVWYALKSVGCERVGVLDGGWRAWEEVGGRACAEARDASKGCSEVELGVEEGGLSRATVGLEQMRRIVGSEVVIVDARSRRQFTGVERRGKRGGHIPGAMNVPYRSLLREGVGGLKRDEELRAVLEKAGVMVGGGEREYVVYCNGGVASTVVIFAMVRCGVGLERIRNYCGSMNEWGNAEDTELVEGMEGAQDV